MRLIALAIVLGVLAACSGNQDAATGFYTENAPPPASARISNKEGVPRDGHGRPYHYALLNQAVPEFETVQVDGSPVSEASLSGHWTIVEFWGLWCPDCMSDAELVQELADRLEGNERLRFLSVHTPPSPTRLNDAYGKYQSVQDYFDRTGRSYPVALDLDASIAGKFQLASTPLYIVVDPEGVIRGFRSSLSSSGDRPVDVFIEDVEVLIQGR